MAHKGRPYPFHFRRDLSLSYNWDRGMPKGFVWYDMQCSGTYQPYFDGAEVFVPAIEEKSRPYGVAYFGLAAVGPVNIGVNIVMNLVYDYPEYFSFYMRVDFYTAVAQRNTGTFKLTQQLPNVILPGMQGSGGFVTVGNLTPGRIRPAPYALF